MSACSDELIGKCISTIEAVFTMSGFRDNKKEKPYIKRAVEHSRRMIELCDGKWMSYFKYKIAAFFASHRRQVLPPFPVNIEHDDDPSVILGGKAKRWFDSLSQDRREIIALSVLNSKRGFPRASSDDLAAAAEETFKVLTSPSLDPADKETASWADESEIDSMLSKRNLKSYLTRVIEEVFRNKSYTHEDTMEPLFPSTNANYNNTRTKAGTVGEIMRHEVLLRGLHGSNIVKTELRGKGKSQYIYVNREELDSRWAELFERAKVFAMVEEPIAVPVALAEALKIRVISKGPPMTYFVLKPLQRWLWRTLHSHSSGTFRLIGEEVTEDIVNKQLGTLREGESYLSGDYKAATDNLRGWISNYIVEEITRVAGLDEDTSELFKRALTGHIIESPLTGERQHQLQGQLMGSVVSFPVLCIANAAICLWTRETSVGRSLTLKTANMLVNGDDLVLRCDANAFRFWKLLAEYSGMKPSIGKCYFSREFLHINSTEFLEKEVTYKVSERYLSPKERTPMHLEHRRFINLGLVFGLKRSAKGSLEEANLSDWGSLQSLSVNANILKQTCPEEDWPRVYEYYLKLNNDKLIQTNLSWFLPEHLGGVGLPIDSKHQPSKKDLRVAAVLYKHYRIPKQRPDMPWKVWQYAQGRMGTLPSISAVSDFQGGSMRDENSLLSLYCIEALFACDINNLYNEKKSNKLIEALRSMEKTWRSALKSNLMSSTEPFQVTALPIKSTQRGDHHVLNIPARYSDVPSHTLGASVSSSSRSQSIMTLGMSNPITDDTTAEDMLWMD
jgi:hypothetical protein